MNYIELLEKLMQHFSSGEYQEEAVQAKMEFCDFAGVMDEFAPDYEMKFHQFTDWYLFLRPLNRSKTTPVAEEYAEKRMNLTQEERGALLNLLSSRHSLFEFLKLTKEDLYVRDLFSNYKIVIKNSPVIHGFERDSFFEARLIPHEDTFVFSNCFTFHPADAKKFIQTEIKRVSKLPEEKKVRERELLIFKLFKMKYKFERYVHVKISDVYSDESRLKF